MFFLFQSKVKFHNVYHPRRDPVKKELVRSHPVVVDARTL